MKKIIISHNERTFEFEFDSSSSQMLSAIRDQQNISFISNGAYVFIPKNIVMNSIILLYDET